MGTRNMKDICKMKRTMSSGNNRVTNVINVHTCAIGYFYLIIVMIAIVHHQFVEFSSDMISSPKIKVPIGVSTMRD
jgi:hypothetical protein